MRYTGHPFWERYLEPPVVQVYVLATNEAWLNETLEAMAKQDYPSFKVWVVLDCPDLNRLQIAFQHHLTNKFTVTVSPFLQGLSRAVNTALQDTLPSQYLFITGAEYIYPPDTISTFVKIAEKHPQYILGPNLQVPGFDRFGPSWAYFMHKSVAKHVGLWDMSFGPGGVGPAHDWMIRAWREKYEFKAVKDIQVPYRQFSIQDKISDWSIVEGRAYWAQKYGGDLMNPQAVVQGFPGWEWIDKEGNPLA